jgi:hypothetical protein
VAGQPIGQKLADFWGWRLSDLLDNLERGVLAEFIVATAPGIPADGVRDGGAVWDLTTPDGVRIEVKSAAYLQAWAQKHLSRITLEELTTATEFGGLPDAVRLAAASGQRLRVSGLASHWPGSNAERRLGAG